MPARFRAAVLVLLVAFSSSCSAAHTSRDPNTLVALTRVDAGTMNPLYSTTVQDSIYEGFIFDSLTTIGPDLDQHPWLATSWTASPDGLHWTIDLRRGVTWSDGAPFTSRDVVFTYETMKNPKVAFNGSSDVDYISRITADGPYRVHMTLEHPSAVFVTYALAEPILPEHLLGKIPPERQRFSSLGQHPIGTGPYMLASWQHDTEAVFVRNPHFWHGVAKIARLDFRVIFNDQAELEALENGSADLIDSIGSTSALQLAHDAPQIVVMTFPSLYIDTVEINQHRPGLSDVAVRQAMMYGYDRPAAIRGFFHDRVQAVDQIVVPALKRWYDPNTLHYGYDPARARALLDSAGWRPGADGVRRKGTVRLSFEMLINQGSAAILDELLAFVADMKAIGIEISVRQLDFASMSARTYSGHYDLVADARGGTVDPDWTAVLASWERPPAGANTTGYADPVVDNALRAGLRTLDDARRRAIYDVMQRRMAETLPMLFWYTQYAATAHSPRLHLDPRTTLQAPLIYYNVFDWTLGP